MTIHSAHYRSHYLSNIHKQAQQTTDLHTIVSQKPSIPSTPRFTHHPLQPSTTIKPLSSSIKQSSTSTPTTMSSQRPEDEATISIPSIAIVAVIGYLIYRYFWSSSTSSTSRTNNNGLRFTNAQVDTIAQMFPQLSRRDIMWDLQRNRGSVQATTERLLTGRGLDPVCSPQSCTLSISSHCGHTTQGTTAHIYLHAFHHSSKSNIHTYILTTTSTLGTTILPTPPPNLTLLQHPNNRHNKQHLLQTPPNRTRPNNALQPALPNKHIRQRKTERRRPR